MVLCWTASFCLKDTGLWTEAHWLLGHFWCNTSCDRCPCLDNMARQMFFLCPFSSSLFPTCHICIFLSVLTYFFPKTSLATAPSHFRATLQDSSGVYILPQMNWILYRHPGQKIGRRNNSPMAECSWVTCIKEWRDTTFKQTLAVLALARIYYHTCMCMMCKHAYQILYLYVMVCKYKYYNLDTLNCETQRYSNICSLATSMNSLFKSMFVI